MAIRTELIHKIILEKASGEKISADFDAVVAGEWQLHLNKKHALQLAEGEQLTAHFQQRHEFLSGPCEMLGIDAQSGMALISEPAINQSPSSNGDMVVTDLNTAVIIMDSIDPRQRYIDSTRNRIRQLSATGAMLDCQQALPEAAESLLLLTSLNENANSRLSIYLPGRIVKTELSEGQQAAARYEIRFKLMFPQFREELRRFLHSRP